ncbi:MAG: efflux RND transporter periplasmic adaptor subunit [Phascolarctobacterium sp.]|nr:efflux RND transporter periplasmic adaptor subunit [Phascolarctobacterium sp.]
MMDFVKKNKYVIAFCVLLLAGGVGGYKYYQSTKTKNTATVRTGTVDYGTIKDSVSATGSLKAIDNVDISSKITGRIVEVNVKENDHVTAGQLLLRLDDSALLATENQRKATFDESAKTLNRYTELLNRGAIAQSTYDTALMNYQVALANYEQAVSNREDTLIYSPIDGYVIGKPTPVGQTISSGISTPQVIMSIANLDKMQIEALVDESDIGNVRLGQKVEFTVDAYPEETFTGVVSLISRSATTTNNVIYYKTYVDVDDSKNKLFPTMTARSEIIINQTDDTLMIPSNCVQRDENKKVYVQKYDAKKKAAGEKIYVELGMTGDDMVQVKSGDIKKGDTLVVKSSSKTATTSNKGMFGGPPH